VCTTVTGTLGWLLIPIAFGEAFKGAVEPFLWLLPGAFGYAALSIFVGALLAAQAPGLTTTSRAVSLGAGLMLDVALIPVLGATGAAIAASTAFLAGGATAAVLYRRTSGYAWRELLPGRRDVAFLGLVAARALPRMQAST
jgi:O-antigen/teichoic acid export membrane protein